MGDFKESDWKILRKLHPIALERFCRRVLEEDEQAASQSSQSYHERYLNVYQLVRERDRAMGPIFDDLRRSRAFFNVIGMKAHDLLTDEEFAQFSEDLRGSVELYLR